MIHILFSFAICLFSPTVEENNPSVKIQIRNEEGKMTETYISSDPEMISKLKSCLKGRSAPNFKCGYTGKIIFIEPDGSQWNAEFNLTSCNHIVFMRGNRLISRHLKKESIDLLKELTNT